MNNCTVAHRLKHVCNSVVDTYAHRFTDDNKAVIDEMICLKTTYRISVVYGYVHSVREGQNDNVQAGDIRDWVGLSISKYMKGHEGNSPKLPSCPNKFIWQILLTSFATNVPQNVWVQTSIILYYQNDGAARDCNG